MPLIYWLFLFIVLGVANAAYLHWQYLLNRRIGRTMYCPLGGSCEEVVASKFGTTFGIKNERWGIIYYVLLILALVAFLRYPQTSEILSLGILTASLLAALFSTYLVIVQFFVIREYCSWCVAATVINYIILAIEVPLFL
ncbi:vitamin K epoxide reductase family protein [Candidatus Parcubacteria bacterium]|nr:MAG: vitamin K epoxide reductase family protein [Candidatus Parcubacteria bacterium]